MESPFANEEGKSRLIWHEDEYYFGASMYQIIKLTKDQRDNQVVEISDLRLQNLHLFNNELPVYGYPLTTLD